MFTENTATGERQDIRNNRTSQRSYNNQIGGSGEGRPTKISSAYRKGAL